MTDTRITLTFTIRGPDAPTPVELMDGIAEGLHDDWWTDDGIGYYLHQIETTDGYKVQA